jgi:hypothetical protein
MMGVRMKGTPNIDLIDFIDMKVKVVRTYEARRNSFILHKTF